MTVRRVYLDADESQAYSTPGEIVPAALSRRDAWTQKWLEDEDRQDAEFAEHIDARRDHRLEDDPMEEDDPRERDLASRPAVPSPQPVGQPLTPAQLRTANDWDEVQPEAIKRETADTNAHVGCEVWTERHHEDASGEPATRWLREHDPQRTPEGIAAEIADALQAHGLSYEDVRRALAGGRPTADRQALRARLRAALATIYEDDRSRTLVAAALGCSRQSLHTLMTV